MSERELFLYELNGRGYEFRNKTWLQGLGEHGGTFEDDQLNMVYEMWCASANRQGYKLVPVEPTEKMQIYGNRLALADKGYRYDCASIYESMIGACDE